MVLNKFFITLCACLYLAACSHLGYQADDNRSPNKPVVPANNQTVLFPSKPATPASSSDDSTKNQAENLNPDPKPPVTSQPPTDTPNQTQVKSADVITSIKQSAQKAIDNQQWLRAQHHLEHALRIAPKDAEVFYLYAVVYEGLGVKEQMINMLKRSIFLAKPNSEIYQLADTKLKQNATK